VEGDRVGVQLSGVPAPEPGTWLRRGETVLYDSPWVRLAIADVLMPDGTQVDHHVVRMPRPAAGTIILRDGAVLLLHRHRFITDTWGWEIPAGAVDDGESVEEAAIREAREESGWRPTTVELLCRFHPANGILDQAFHIFLTRDAVDAGGPTDTNEAARVEWVPVDEVRRMLLDGRVSDGLSFGALAYAFTAAAL
jgi:8-oxo-dGTP pyrophosphatase MutT (NUDIX family)